MPAILQQRLVPKSLVAKPQSTKRTSLPRPLLPTWCPLFSRMATESMFWSIVRAFSEDTQALSSQSRTGTRSVPRLGLATGFRLRSETKGNASQSLICLHSLSRRRVAHVGTGAQFFRQKRQHHQRCLTVVVPRGFDRACICCLQRRSGSADQGSLQ